MNMGKRIEAELRERNWSRAMLYDLVPGLDDGTLSAIIKRDSRSSKFAPAIASGLGVELHWLLTGEGEKHLGGKPPQQQNSLSSDHRAIIEGYDCAPELVKKMLLAHAKEMIRLHGKKKRQA